MGDRKPDIHESWYELLKLEFESESMAKLRLFLKSELQSKTIYPPMSKVFNAFRLCSFNSIKVVILGQDPYHGPKQAHGLCFSVLPPVKPPPSLINIYNELHTDIGVPIPNHGSLVSWAKQGVFLLNTVLTVQAGRAGSHRGRGWEVFTDAVIKILNRQAKNLVFLLWGSSAQSKIDMIDQDKHLVLKAPHPSPLSAHRGFFGCQHFSKTNAYLVSKGIQPIDWIIPPITDADLTK